jgi:hypothetical protein
MEDKLQIMKMKEEIISFMGKEIQNFLDTKETGDCIGGDKTLSFLYCGMERRIDQYFCFDFFTSEEGVIVSAQYIFKNNKFQIAKGNNLDNIFDSLKKEVKRNSLLTLYGK